MNRQLFDLESLEALRALFGLGFGFFNLGFDLLYGWLGRPLGMVVVGVVDEHILVLKLHMTEGALETDWVVVSLEVAPLRAVVLGWWASTFVVFWLSLVSSATHEEFEDLVSERWLVRLFYGFLASRRARIPFEIERMLLYFFVLSSFLNGLAIMLVLKSVLHAEMHLALRALEVIDIV